MVEKGAGNLVQAIEIARDYNFNETEEFLLDQMTLQRTENFG